MSYVIFDTRTSKIIEVVRHRPYRRTAEYKTRAAAKAAITRMDNKFFEKSPEQYADESPLLNYMVAEKGYYHAKIEQMVERTNMMTGKKYMESVNTPAYCSPASESYWSM